MSAPAALSASPLHYADTPGVDRDYTNEIQRALYNFVNSEGLSCLATSIASSLMTSHRPEPAAKALDSSKHAMFYYACFLALVAVHSVDGRNKRELPLSYNCDPRQYGSCAKADLVSTSVADCKRSRWWQTCKPINDYALSSVVDIPDSSRASCNLVNGLPIRCGSE